MAMQGIWSGTISFSLVAIPVQLVRAIEPGRVSFRMLHSADYSPLRRKMFCPEEERIVSPEEIVRGYEIGPGRHFLITDEELESVSPERSRTIEISEFIDLREVDPIYYDHPYYLVPEKGGEKAYRLLAEVMERTGKAGLARFVLDEREHLVAVRSAEGVLALITLHYAGEVLPAGDILAAGGQIDALEKGRMKKEIKKRMSRFDPDAYADGRRKRLLDLLKKKSKERPPVEAPAAEGEETEGPADLIAALQKSMRKLKEDR